MSFVKFDVVVIPKDFCLEENMIIMIKGPNDVVGHIVKTLGCQGRTARMVTHSEPLGGVRRGDLSTRWS